MDAYERGDYATALKEWRPLAEQGDVRAQFNLGRMYDNGYGVPEDDAEAAAFFKILTGRLFVHSSEQNINVWS